MVRKCSTISVRLVSANVLFMSAKRKAPLLGIIQHGGENWSTSLCSVVRATRKFRRCYCSERVICLQERLGLPQTYLQSQWNLRPSVKILPTTEQKHSGEEEEVVASRSDCHHEDREFTVDSGASLHMMSQNKLTCGEKHQKIERIHRHHDR